MMKVKCPYPHCLHRQHEPSAGLVNSSSQSHASFPKLCVVQGMTSWSMSMVTMATPEQVLHECP